MGEVADLKSALSDQADRFENITGLSLYDYDVIQGEYIRYATGINVSSSGFLRTDYIDLNGASEIRYSRLFVNLGNTPSHGIAFYDANKTYISGINSGFVRDGDAHYEDYEVNVPDGAKYARFTIRGSAYIDGFYVLKYNHHYISNLNDRVKNVSTSLENVSTSLENVMDVVSEEKDVDFNQNARNVSLGSDNTWIGGKSCLVPLSGKELQIYVTAQSNANGSVAFLVDDSTVVHETANYVDGTGRIVIPAGTSNSIPIPTGANYLYIHKISYSGINFTPNAVKIYSKKVIPNVDTTLTQTGEAADAKITGDKFEKICNLSDEAIPFEIDSVSSAIRYSSGLVYSSSNFSATGYVDISKFNKITYARVIAHIATTPTHGMAFYDSQYNYISGIRSEFDENATDTYDEYTTDIPQNAKYARFTVRADNIDDFYIRSENVLKSRIFDMLPKNESYSTNKWLVGLVGMTQKNNGKFNVAMRMRLLCDTEWTPIAPVPRQRRVDGNLVFDSFSTGEKQIGVPYGAQLTYEQWLGKNISIETFLSALANPNSVIYDFSRVGTAYRASGWYSVNCSKAVVYALNLRNTYASGSFASDPNIRVIANAGEYTAEDIQIGDIIEAIGVHTAFITDLVYNTFGELSQIEVSEAVTPTCRRKRWNIYGSFENFFIEFADYRLERYDLIDTVPPVNMEAMYPYISPSIGLNYGSKSNYTTSDIVEITLLQKKSNTLIVKKSGTLIDTIDVTNYDESAIVQYTQTTPGWYEVGFDGDDSKNYVGFCINDNTALYDSNSGKLSFSSSESTMFMVSYCAGSSRSHISDAFPTSTDLENGYMTLSIPSSASYIHVTFANDYGKTVIELAL